MEARCVENNQIARRTFGQAIREERERLGLSQDGTIPRGVCTFIAPILAPSSSAKSAWGIEIAHALACALGLKLSELVRKAE